MCLGRGRAGFSQTGGHAVAERERKSNVAVRREICIAGVPPSGARPHFGIYIYTYIPIYYILTYSVYPEFVPEYLQKRGLGLRIGLRIKGLRIGLRIKKHLSLLCAPKCRLASLPPTGKQTNWSIAQLRGRQPLREKQGPRDKYIETRSPLVRTRVCASNWVCTHM